MTEDAGGIARVTKTLAYDNSGHATETEDAAGHIFTTTYANQDYQVANIAETDSGTIPLVTYTYGSGQGTPSSITDNGQVTSVTDNLSGVEDSFTYDHTLNDGGFGQPCATSEGWPWDTSGSQHGYGVGYVYNNFGDRAQTTYTTDYGTTKWGYADYASVGKPSASSCSRAPQTMRLLDSSGNPTAEEFHYQYDGSGALLASDFAMTPASGYSPSSGNSYYSSSEVPSTRARVVYDNGSGENQGVYYYWDAWSSGSSAYTSSTITGFQYGYDPVSMLKTGATFLDPNSGATGWTTDHTESYGYDSSLDYLTSADYGSGTETWTYDAAGNRLSDSANTGTWSYDNLNRMTASPGLTYSNDILGNRLSNSVTSNGWDQLNRMTSFVTGGGSPVTWSYAYRADGMRVSKSATATTVFAYDGQMGFEDVDNFGASPATVKDYAIGARGIDRIAIGTGVGYPIYDGHGNMVATLAKSGSSFSIGNQKLFDAWGNVLSGSLGDPTGRYCASLGHKQDDESGLTYMRARYYEPSSGRFINEDSAGRGLNWCIYCSDDPVGRTDRSGAIDSETYQNFIWNIQQEFWEGVDAYTAYMTGKLSLGGAAAVGGAVEAIQIAIARISFAIGSASWLSEGAIGLGESTLSSGVASGLGAGPTIELGSGEVTAGAGGYGTAKVIGQLYVDQLTDLLEMVQDGGAFN